MELNLERPLLFFDIESTGLNIASDSIIELCFVKILPGGEQRVKTWRVKPWDYEHNCQRPINPSAQAVHGISAEDLADCPTFSEIADEVVEWLADSDLAGFNSAKFDLPLLAEEIERVRRWKARELPIDLHQMKMVDVQNIFHKMEQRTLSAAYKFYCQKDLENAHSAEADTLATYEILKSQLGRYPNDLQNDVKMLAEFSTRTKLVDYAGRIVLNDKDQPTINFGKHKGENNMVFKDIDKNTVDFVPNFDEKRKEPVVLPPTSFISLLYKLIISSSVKNTSNEPISYPFINSV